MLGSSNVLVGDTRRPTPPPSRAPSFRQSFARHWVPEIVPNVNRQSVAQANDLTNVFTQGNRQRKVGGTKMNAESSRSHSVFSILLEVTHFHSSRVLEHTYYIETGRMSTGVLRRAITARHVETRGAFSGGIELAV